MASNPMAQAVLRFQHQQTTTPFQPIEPVSTRHAGKPQPRPINIGPQPVQTAMPGAPQWGMAKPKEEKKEDNIDAPPFDPLEEEPLEEEDEEANGDEEEQEETHG